MAKKKVLIVDDDREFLEEIQEMLDMSGYEAVAVNDSMAALDTARIEKPDVILLDLKMGGMNGFEVKEKLKQVPQTTNIPVIAITGYFTKEEHFPLINTLGMASYLKKPLNPLDVIARIEMVLGR